MEGGELLRGLIPQLENPDQPLRRLEAVRIMRRYLALVEEDAIPDARAHGASTMDIGRALGMTRQGVSYRLKSIAERRVGAAPGADILKIPDLEESKATELD